MLKVTHQFLCHFTGQFFNILIKCHDIFFFFVYRNNSTRHSLKILAQVAPQNYMCILSLPVDTNCESVWDGLYRSGVGQAWMSWGGSQWGGVRWVIQGCGGWGLLALEGVCGSVMQCHGGVWLVNMEWGGSWGQRHYSIQKTELYVNAMG